MVQFRPLLFVFALAALCDARKFYDDDPLLREPPPMRVERAHPRKLSDIYDIFSHILATPGEKQRVEKRVRAQDVNTVGEVLEGAWYEARHGARRMTRAELAAGPGDNTPPAEGPWTVLRAKTEGVTPGFQIRDSRGNDYLLKFDPIRYPELATAADVISSKFFHALGYHVPENYIVRFDRSRLVLADDASFRDARGRKRKLTSKEVTEILMRTHRDRDGVHRATASRIIRGEILHSFRYYGTRSDDPNDIIPHEHRRSLRGLHVFAAWLGHEDSRAINTLDVLVQEGSLRYMKHFLIDFGSTLGSASVGVNSPRSGFEQFFTWDSSAKAFFTLGLYVPRWARIEYPDLPSVGRFSAKYFDPITWTPEYPNPAFDNRLPEDTFWAARQVMRFSDDDIRAIVETGKYSDPEAARYVADTIIARRDAVGRAYLSQPLGLDNIRIDDGRIAFDDLAVHYGYAKEPKYEYRWSVFDNNAERKTPIAGARSAAIPAGSHSYTAVDIVVPGNENRQVTIYLKRAPRGFKIVGIDRESD
jgi:hypothetical protein